MIKFKIPLYIIVIPCDFIALLYFAFGLYGCSNGPNPLSNMKMENKVIGLCHEQIVKKNVIREFNDQEPQIDTIDYSKINWEKIDEGLLYTEMPSKLKSEFGDSKIIILKINPEYYDFYLMSAKETQVYSLKTAEDWAKEKDLIAVINAGMYMDDLRTNAGYMKNYDFVNNDRLNEYKSILSFNRKEECVPEIQIIDLENQNWSDLKTKYNSYVQGIRMIDIYQTNRWSQQNKIWSTVCIGIDKEGNALFVFCRSPYSVHDLNNILLESPVNIYNLMYLEGGPEASFYLNHNGKEVKKCGSYETGYWEKDDLKFQESIPNIIGIRKK